MQQIVTAQNLIDNIYKHGASLDKESVVDSLVSLINLLISLNFGLVASPNNSNNTLSDVVRIQPFDFILDTAIGISCLLIDEIPSKAI